MTMLREKWGRPLFEQTNLSSDGQSGYALQWLEGGVVRQYGWTEKDGELVLAWEDVKRWSEDKKDWEVLDELSP